MRDKQKQEYITTTAAASKNINRRHRKRANGKQARGKAIKNNNRPAPESLIHLSPVIHKRPHIHC